MAHQWKRAKNILGDGGPSRKEGESQRVERRCDVEPDSSGDKRASSDAPSTQHNAPFARTNALVLSAARLRQAIYLAYRAGLHWSTFSSYHIFGYIVLLLVSIVCKSMLVEAAASSTGSE